MTKELPSVKPIKDLVESMESVMDLLPEKVQKLGRELRAALDSGGSRAKLFTLTLELLATQELENDEALKALVGTFNRDLHAAVKASGMNMPTGDDFNPHDAANKFLRCFAELAMATTYRDRRGIMEQLSGPDRVSIVSRDSTKALPPSVTACLVALDECIVKVAALIEEVWETMDRAVQKEKNTKKADAKNKKDS